MDSIKQHFEDEAGDFDRLIVTLIPDYLSDPRLKLP